ncbi:hypothetical protein FBU30_003338 [Linnemannia zychae]|nr:hypothetical protein FBU30_003338 [Linnemannia zychae]
MADSVAAPQLSPRRSPGQPLVNSTSSSFASLQTIAQARTELEGRLSNIHNDLQLTQTIGLLFVKRQEDLKNCYEQLQLLEDQEKQATADQGEGIDAVSERGNDASSKPLPESFKEQLVALDREFQEGQDGIVGLKGLIDAQLPVTASNSTNDLSTSRSGTVLAPSALPSSVLPAQTISKPRRHKVVMSSAPSTNDTAFPLQIQEELLNQVRYWTTQAELKEKLNQEYDLKLNEQERIIDALNKQRRLREEGEERQKEDQWNLELANQELRNQNAELQAQLSKATHENIKIQKSFAAATEQVEQLKDKEEKTSSQLELVKLRHEQDMATMRKHMAGVQREKSELLTKVEDLNATLTLQQRKLAKKAALDAIAHVQDSEEKAAAESTVEAPILIQAPTRTLSGEEAVAPAAIPVAVAAEPKVASLARETSYAHHQSVINDLQAKLSKEITEKEELISAKEELINEKEELLTEKEELVKMLADREETIEAMRLEGVAVFEPSSLHEKASLGSIHGHVSRNTSDMDILDDADGFDNRDESMSHSESGSRDFSNGRSSPFPTGGLFAELAQATSTNNIKAVEYKDQEVMTEPIDSWIHTIPGLIPTINNAPIPDALNKDTTKVKEDFMLTDSANNQDVVEAQKSLMDKDSVDRTDLAIPDIKDTVSIEEQKVESIETTITGKPGTETKQIPIDIVASTRVTETPEVVENASSNVKAAAITTEHDTTLLSVETTNDDVQYTPTLPAQEAKKEEKEEGEEEEEGEESAPRATKSSVDNGRRHTCDMSQTFSESSSALEAPPTPVVPADFVEAVAEKPSLKSEDSEFRVSFGSAFGGDPNATDTGRIKSVYQGATNSSATSSEQAYDLTADISTDEQDDDVAASKLETMAPLIAATAAAATTASVTTTAATNSSPEQKSNSPANEPSIGSTQTAEMEKEMSAPTTVRVQTEEPHTSASKLNLPYPSTTVVEVSSHSTYTYAAPSTSQVNLTHLNNGAGNTTQHHHIITDSSGATVGRNPDYRTSPNGSISSLSTDYNNGGYFRNGRRNSNSSNFDLTPTDPTMIQLITQTMIGDYLWKYTRRRMATMMNEKMHWRFFWVHPYTKTMHWSHKNPGSGGPSSQSGKSALILAITQITEETTSTDLPAVSLLIQTTSRNIKLKAPTREKHDLWFRSISYLLSRPSSPGADAPGDNQTWSEVQASHHPSSSRSHPTNDTVMSLRQSESGANILRKKSSLARIQSVFGRNSASRDGASPSSNPTGAVGSPRIGPTGAPLGVVSTAAAHGNGAGTNTAEKRASLTNLATVYPVSQPGTGLNDKHGVFATVNGGSILAQTESEQLRNDEH